MDSSKDSILKVINLSAQYRMKGSMFRGEFLQAIHDISFEIRKGECLALFGKLASGKTTIAKIILGHLRASSGQVIFKNCDLFDLKGINRSRLMRKIQPIFQDPFQSIHPTRKIGKQLFDAYEYSKNVNFYDTLNNVSIEKDYLTKYPYQLSGGQLQRVCIARALLAEPEILILDEPFTAQDQLTKVELIKLLNDLRGKYNLSYLLITHDIFTIITMADRIIQIEDGTIKKHYFVDEFKEEFISEM